MTIKLAGLLYLYITFLIQFKSLILAGLIGTIFSILFGIFLFWYLPALTQHLSTLFSSLWMINIRSIKTLPDNSGSLSKPADVIRIDEIPSSLSQTDSKLHLVSTIPYIKGIVPSKKISDHKIKKLAGGEIISLLGSGGMSNVYLIEKSQQQVYRAVKVSKPDCISDSLKIFRTEMLISSRLDHPNIVKSYRLGNWFSLPYIEMEYVNGASLNKVLKKCSTLTVEQVLSIGISVCKALHYAHNKIFTIGSQSCYGIIHRDLKPANIILSKEGQIKLSDFGIAYPIVFPDQQTDSHPIIGTMPYLAPEQFENKNITYRTDIYILGVTLYELLCGVRAFPQTNISELIKAKNTGSYIPIKRIIRVDNAISKIIEKAMSTCPSERFSTTDQFGHAMEKHLCTRESVKFELLALAKRLWYE